MALGFYRLSVTERQALSFLEEERAQCRGYGPRARTTLAQTVAYLQTTTNPALRERLLQHKLQVQTFLAAEAQCPTSLSLTLAHERLHDIQNIEQDIRILNDMARDLALMIGEAEQHLGTIEEGVHATKEATGRAVEELAEADRQATIARRRKAWLVFTTVAIIVVTVGVATPFVYKRIVG